MMNDVSIEEKAWHEAGHAVVGYLFYPPVQTTIKQRKTEFGNFIGNTICEIPHPIVFEDFRNEMLFPMYLQIALYCWAGEYFQKTISIGIDEKGLKIDKEMLLIYFNEKQLKTFEYFKSCILDKFFESETILEMVSCVANELLIHETLNHKEINYLLARFDFNVHQHMELLMDKYYLLICQKYSETDLKPM